MYKRPADSDGDLAYLKRQKIAFSGAASQPSNASPTTEVQSARKLRQILTFSQDVPQAKQAIQSFKAFLESIADSETESVAKIVVLTEYLQEQKKTADQTEGELFLGDLIRTWSFAAQSNNDSLLSAVPAVLALLLRTISNILDLADYGLQLGRVLLQKPQQELISRGVTASKTKDFIISPALRLLREVLIFDGGSLAKQVFRTRDETFRSLARNLRLKYTGVGIEDRRKPSVRTNALRFILSALKFLPTESKRDILNGREVVAALTRDIKDDPPFMVREILETLTTSILKDETLPRDAKVKILNANSLTRIAILYRYHQFDEQLNNDQTVKSVATAAHEFMLLACTSPGIGILNSQNGFYPRGINPDEVPDLGFGQQSIDLGIESIEWMNKFTEVIPVRNTILYDFIQELRPWSSLKQSELLLAIFESAPELIAGFFIGKKDFSFEPKLTATWVGYSAFLFSSLQLPVPNYFGHQQQYARLPPPTSIVIENILPRALNQKVLTHCLNQKNQLVSFFVVRLLSVALTKLRTVLGMHYEANSAASSIWTQAAEKLTIEFCQRCPSIKDIISSFRNVPHADLMQREAFTKLLVLYYEVVPRVALEVKFDVSSTISKALLSMDENVKTPQDRILAAMELENLFLFANYSTGMRWFIKLGELTISPFMAMLKISAEAPPDFPLVKLRSVLNAVVKESQILQTQTNVSALETFILCLRSLQGNNAASVLEFLDDCISRCASNPIKYIFAFEDLQAETGQEKEKEALISLVTLAVIEQWPFITKSADNDALKEIAGFVASYVAASIAIKEDEEILSLILRKLISATEDPDVRDILETSMDRVGTIVVPVASTKHRESDANAELTISTRSERMLIPKNFLEDPDASTEDHSALTRWTTKEVDEVIEAGHAAALVKLLSSKHLGVRKEAATNISKFTSKLRESTYEEKDQIFILLNEVVETAKLILDAEPLPGVLSSFAVHAIAVLNDPLHVLYPKVNKFLSLAPCWDLEKVPLLYKILDEKPSRDDSHYPEISWLLTYMLAGFQTQADMAIFRKRRVFEKLFSLYNNPYLAGNLRDQITHILYRGSTIEGGSTTLITRFSTMTWLQAQIALEKGTPLKVLLEQILETSDSSRVGRWSKNGAKAVKADTVQF